MPITSDDVAEAGAIRKRCPSAVVFGQNRLAIRSLMIATGVRPETSSSVNVRPDTSATASVSYQLPLIPVQLMIGSLPTSRGCPSMMTFAPLQQLPSGIELEAVAVSTFGMAFT